MVQCRGERKVYHLKCSSRKALNYAYAVHAGKDVFVRVSGLMDYSYYRHSIL